MLSQVRRRPAAENRSAHWRLSTANSTASRSKDGYASYDSVSGEQRKQIADKAQALADALDGIDPALGLSGL